MARPKGQGVLTRQGIVAAAIKLIDSFGLDALSMRRLGSELGVDPMSIYHHIPNKDALLHAVVEDVFARMPVPSVRSGPFGPSGPSWSSPRQPDTVPA